MSDITCYRNVSDVCGCSRLYLVDISLPIDKQTETPVDSYTSPVDGVTYTPERCKEHAHLTDTVEHFTVVLEEMQRKNRTLGKIAELFPSLCEDGVVNDALVKYSYDADRNLVIDSPTLTGSEKQQLTDATDDTVSVA